MKIRWSDSDARQFVDRYGEDHGEELALRTYTSRLIGVEPSLVLHGGGNTSVKGAHLNLFGETEQALFIKASGRNLTTLAPEDHVAVELAYLQRLQEVDDLSDSELLNALRTHLFDHHAPTPSIESPVHACLPGRFVDHTHADAVLAVTNHPDGEESVQEIYGNRVIIIPYVMPGFVLAKKVRELTQDKNWSDYEGMILMNHGIFTFDDEARESYEKMIRLVSEAEEYVCAKGTKEAPKAKVREDLVTLGGIRKKVSEVAGKPMLAVIDQSDQAGGFSRRQDVSEIGTRGPITPDHVLRTKNIPVILDENPKEEVDTFKTKYLEYFQRHTDGQLTCLDPAPRWAVWKDFGTLVFGRSVKETGIIADIIDHTRKTIQQVEDWSVWKALPEKDLFEVEYWELEQAKLGKSGKAPDFQGKIALVSGAASGIGQSCAETLHQHGAAVLALDLNPEIETIFSKPGIRGLCCDVTDDKAIQKAVDQTVRSFGGLDILVSNAGNFPAGLPLDKMDPETWDSSMRLNLSSHQRLLTAATPFLQQSLDGAVVFIASRNVPAPGPGASAYSVAKAGLTQLARMAALELESYGVRVNVLHPDCVYDTGLWSEGVLQGRADKYGMSVEEYKSRNILKKEVTSREVSEMVAVVAGPIFSKTTGAQIPIDGGNDRVI